ncbi:hypothetical protein WR25_01481 [Diploscapter pachys]|uniref:Uncharacterized protein n=1 Tax=Diploscapter pachys TaxID=2018661 RepID=A0A2A2K9F0_9BILA|nr:hypothetical protein WR25_01481 [Diploscapter pachys]
MSMRTRGMWTPWAMPGETQKLKALLRQQLVGAFAGVIEDLDQSFRQYVFDCRGGEQALGKSDALILGDRQLLAVLRFGQVAQVVCCTKGVALGEGQLFKLLQRKGELAGGGGFQAEVLELEQAQAIGSQGESPFLCGNTRLLSCLLPVSARVARAVARKELSWGGDRRGACHAPRRQAWAHPLLGAHAKTF